MNIPVLIGAVLLIGAALVHILAGEATNIRALLASEIPSGLQQEFRLTWHVAGIDMLVSGGFMLGLAFTDAEGGSLLIAFTALRVTLYGIAALALLLLTRRDLLFKVPQWILFLVIAGLLWLGW
jgi:hypothetical protein